MPDTIRAVKDEVVETMQPLLVYNNKSRIIIATILCDIAECALIVEVFDN